MNAPDHEHFESKLEATEARMDGRVAAIEAKIDGLMARMDDQIQWMRERFRIMDARIDRIEASVANLKTTVIVTGVSAVLAIVIGVATFNAAMVSNMLAAFGSGKELAAIQADLRRQAQETNQQAQQTNRLLIEMQARQRERNPGR